MTLPKSLADKIERLAESYQMCHPKENGLTYRKGLETGVKLLWPCVDACEEIDREDVCCDEQPFGQIARRALKSAGIEEKE